MSTMLDETVVAATAGPSAVLLDTQPLMLAILERVLEGARVATVGKHTTPEEALEAVRTHRPDLFIVELPGGESDAVALETIREARALVPAIKPIVLAYASDAGTVRAARDAGAVEAVSKGSRLGDIALAVSHVLTLPA